MTIPSLEDALALHVTGEGAYRAYALSAYFYARAADLVAIGDDFILSEAVGTRAAQSLVGAQLNMWSRSGALLATSEQLCWFK